MAIPPGVQHVILSGAMPGGESFAFGYWTNPGGGQADADAAHDLWNQAAVKAEVAGLWDASTVLQRVTVYSYGAGGQVTSSDEAGFAGYAGTGQRLHPNYCALVVTLRSATAGRRGRNRFYLPFTGGEMAGAGLMNQASVTNLVNALGPVLVANGAVVVSPTGSASHPLTSVDADYIPDTQRGRQGRLVSGRARYTV